MIYVLTDYSTIANIDIYAEGKATVIIILNIFYFDKNVVT